MALDPRFIVAPAIQQLFRDKDSGNPLSGGKVYFFEDAQRTVPKPVFKLMGSPPNYTYVPLPNPVILNSVGAYDDIIYFFPFDGSPTTTTGMIELYFISVDSSDDIFQFSVEAYPNVTEQDVSGDVDVNFIPNGQFSFHNNIAAEGSFLAGQIRQDITPIAYGGWTFNTVIAAMATDFVTFERFNDFNSFPSSNPRYAVRVQTTVAQTVLQKDLRVRLNNVNRFSSSTQMYTFIMSAKDNNAVTTQVEILLLRNFGTGGSPNMEEEISLGFLNITPTYTDLALTFLPGNNETKNIGTNDDDYIQFIIRFPLDTTYSVDITDVTLLQGEKVMDTFPITTTSQDKYRSIAGFLSTPDFNGQDIGLPLILTKTGIDYERGIVGKLLLTFTKDRPYGYLPLDGTQYETSAINAQDFIPYSRLQKVLFDNVKNVPIFGTGIDYMTLIYSSIGDEAFITTNDAKAVTAAADVNTGFTFRQIHMGLSPAYGITASEVAGTVTNLQIINNERETVTSATVGTSGFSIEIIRTGLTGFLQEITRFAPVAAAGLAGKYFTFESTISAVPTSYYVWFTVAGVGADPAPGGTGIQVNLETADSADIVSNKLMASLNGREVSNITFLDAASFSGGDYWVADALLQFYIWYTIDQVGVDPAPINRSGIKVEVLSTDTASQVLVKTQIAINSKFFSILDIRGLFPRVIDDGAGIDTSANGRISSIPGFFGDRIGTLEESDNLAHVHAPLPPGIDFADSRPFGAFFGGGTVGDRAPTTASAGGQEARSKNFSVQAYIKY